MMGIDGRNRYWYDQAAPQFSADPWTEAEKAVIRANLDDQPDADLLADALGVA